MPFSAKNHAHATRPTVNKRCLRCIVRRWDAFTITADTDEGEISIDYGSTENGRNLTYLQKMLREGMQLNLLDCHVDGTAVTPQLIVVEPDFLVDISSIATCFTGYGHHPLLYTVNRLKPRANTQAILLGNFAGTALDDIINHPDATVADSLRRSFREQAFRFCACDSLDRARFKREAEIQMKNIREAVEILSPKNALLEPSFICEKLGLQGRVDLMTTDMSLLIEQKAGKNMKIERESHDPHGLQQESHYVQLLLYYGILRYNFGRTDQSVDTRLLYSRYPAAHGLVAVNYYRTLFREAIRFRNQVVATDMLIAREGFGRILPLLNPAVIYKDVDTDGYFAEYVQPDLLLLQQQYAALTPTERTYYERMTTFVYREQLYQKLGSADTRLYHSGGADSDLWQMPLTEKVETGNIFTDLKIAKKEKSDPQGGYDLITLSGSAANSNFRRGDIVYLYAYGKEPDVRNSILYKGTLEAISATELTVRLNDGQQNDDVFQQARWAVEHGGSDLMTTSSIRSLHQFITSAPDRRRLLLGQRQPTADTTITLSRSYSEAYDPILLRISQARDFFLLVGPPGSGKTSQALRHIIAENLPRSILLTAYTNRAVDEICSMLEDEGHNYLRIGNESSCDPRFRSRLVESELSHHVASLQTMKALIASTPIFVGTTSTLSSRQEIFSLKHFSIAIVDEASQILEPNIIGLLSRQEIDHFVLIGDYKQLPAVVQQNEAEARIDDPCLNDIGLYSCRQSLFERLIRWEKHCQRTQFIGILDHQGRMHPDVATFSCSHFYAEESLHPVPLPHQQEQGEVYDTRDSDPIALLLRQHRVLFLDTRDSASLLALLVRRIHSYYGTRFDANKTIGIIVTYRNQIAPIRKALESLDSEGLTDISIDTVERYQGSQRDVIIYDFGIEHRYQLDFLTANTFVEHGHIIDRKLNVAMTRARRQLIMMGRADILRHAPLLNEIINDYSGFFE